MAEVTERAVPELSARRLRLRRVQKRLQTLWDLIESRSRPDYVPKAPNKPVAVLLEEQAQLEEEEALLLRPGKMWSEPEDGEEQCA